MIYKLYTDGGAKGNPGPGGCGAILFDPNDKLISFENKFLERTTNNQAEYLALIIGLKLAYRNGISNLNCYLDSELVVKQLNKIYKVKDKKIKELKQQIDVEVKNFKKINFVYISREKNTFADKLVNLAVKCKLNK